LAAWVVDEGRGGEGIAESIVGQTCLDASVGSAVEAVAGSVEGTAAGRDV
jgi:hypothetical protein